MGRNALYNCTTGNHNTAVGGSACLYGLTTGTYNTAMGVDAGQVLTTGSNNTLIGYQAGMSSSPATMVTGSNTVVLGNNSVTGFSCKVSLTSGSDGRDKADITPFNHGLSWIKKLNPVTYRWDNRSDYSDDLSLSLIHI